MKKNRTLFAVVLVLVAFISGLIVGSMDWNAVSRSGYVHVNFESATTEEACFLCGEHKGTIGPSMWKPNNIGILNLNTFDRN